MSTRAAAECLRICLVKLLAPVAAHPHQAHVAQHAQVLRYRRLIDTKDSHNLVHRVLAPRQQKQYLSPPRLRYRIERIRGCRRSSHDKDQIYAYMGICQYRIFRIFNVKMKAFAAGSRINYDSRV